MSQSTLPLLEERFEGWPAGLHLAAISFRSASSQEAVLFEFIRYGYQHHRIPGGRGAEPPGSGDPVLFVEDFHPGSLLRLAVRSRDRRNRGGLECACLPGLRSNAPRCSSSRWITGENGSAIIICSRNCCSSGWQPGLEPGEVADLHRRASAWFEEHGLIDEAIHHALAAWRPGVCASADERRVARSRSTARTGRPWSAGCACCPQR